MQCICVSKSAYTLACESACTALVCANTRLCMYDAVTTSSLTLYHRSHIKGQAFSCLTVRTHPCDTALAYGGSDLWNDGVHWCHMLGFDPDDLRRVAVDAVNEKACSQHELYRWPRWLTLTCGKRRNRDSSSWQCWQRCWVGCGPHLLIGLSNSVTAWQVHVCAATVTHDQPCMKCRCSRCYQDRPQRQVAPLASHSITVHLDHISTAPRRRAF